MAMFPTVAYTSWSSEQWFLNAILWGGPRDRRFEVGHGTPGKWGWRIWVNRTPCVGGWGESS